MYIYIYIHINTYMLYKNMSFFSNQKWWFGIQTHHFTPNENVSGS